MPSVGCSVEQVGGRLLVRLSGELSLASAPRLRARLLQAIVEQPHAVVVNLADLVLREPAVVRVFAAVARQAAMWPGTPLLVCTPDPQTARLLSRGAPARVPVFSSIAQALSMPKHRRTTLICDTLLPVADAAVRARTLATEACARWGLPQLVGLAALIAAELATNAAVHAGTFVAIRFALGARYLLISARDGSGAAPRLDCAPLTEPATGRGLLLVEATAWRWGWHPTADGKMVWASLRNPRCDHRATALVITSWAMNGTGW
ncbi:STAS domain-containing protein [Krasilnikovia cinnamomea]|uniref:STAS domain-containing protein n=1 Tax=Krasilnikovia cinnamomea TaxID=349313 RepID=UPI001A914B16|nr:STAS domain-containing protein [Krasilnikovia cinnamomea]